MHLPINHPLQPFYRTLAGLTGLVLLAFGATSWAQSTAFFGPGDWRTFGLATNRGLATVALVAGMLVVGAAIVGRNVNHRVSLWGGVAMLMLGTLLMPLSHIESNPFNSSLATTIATYLVGLVLMTAGLYSKVGEPVEAQAEEAVRQAA